MPILPSACALGAVARVPSSDNEGAYPPSMPGRQRRTEVADGPLAVGGVGLKEGLQRSLGVLQGVLVLGPLSV